LSFQTIVAFAGPALCILLALAISFRRGQSLARRCFAAGMVLLGAETAFAAASLEAGTAQDVRFWQTLTLLAKSLLPGVWLCFSLTYSRGNYRDFLRNWRFAIIAAFVLPLSLFAGFHRELLEVVPQEDPDRWWVNFGGAAKVLNGVFLVGAVLVVTNLERTFRAAVGTMQWRIKFLLLGLAVIFGARIYTRTQALLFSGHQLGLMDVELGALLIGCVLITIGYFRTGFGEVDVYPSRAVLQTSFTILLAGGYLFLVGVLAQFVARHGESGNFQLQAFLILLAVALLAVFLLSDRVRQSSSHFISRHFKRPQHDFREVWTLYTRSVSTLSDPAGICSASARLLSSTFNALSVSVWLTDDHQEQLVVKASTAEAGHDRPVTAVTLPIAPSAMVVTDPRPFDLEKAAEEWAAALRLVTQGQFREGGNRICVPLVARDRWLGAIVLADRVSARPYTAEELDLLQCLGDQIATSLLQATLTAEILVSKELDAFRTMSAFFVHDLKNVASTLSLMLQNLPVHFDKPEFRQDALRGIGKTVARMNELISRLAVLRQKLQVNAAPLDLKSVVEEALENTVIRPGVELTKELEPVPELLGDKEQLQSVVTNLLVNAGDASSDGGHVKVQTGHRGGWATIAVIDDGCGMTPTFLRDSLFRPFQSTKTNGLGVGMFQSKQIIEAHGGMIQVESDVGSGTTFTVMLPLRHSS